MKNGTDVAGPDVAVVDKLDVADGELPTDGEILADGDKLDIAEDDILVRQGGVEIPAVVPAGNKSGVAASMIPLVVYNGKVYMATGELELDEATAQAMIGEHLGTATGNIDEWSRLDEYTTDAASNTLGEADEATVQTDELPSQDAYPTEFASNMPGEVYAVNGYDKGFRICIRGSYENEGKEVTWITLFDNLNGITLTVGEDLFGVKRLNVKGNYSGIEYLTHEKWDSGQSDFAALDLSEAEVAAFLDALYGSEFEQLDYETNDIYSSDLAQSHVYFRMNDGTSVELRLFENGYVGYQPLGWVFAKMTDEAMQPFEAFFEGCRE
jgi:hypothetical protein